MTICSALQTSSWTTRSDSRVHLPMRPGSSCGALDLHLSPHIRFGMSASVELPALRLYFKPKLLTPSSPRLDVLCVGCLVECLSPTPKSSHIYGLPPLNCCIHLLVDHQTSSSNELAHPQLSSFACQSVGLVPPSRIASRYNPTDSPYLVAYLTSHLTFLPTMPLFFLARPDLLTMCSCPNAPIAHGRYTEAVEQAAFFHAPWISRWWFERIGELAVADRCIIGSVFLDHHRDCEEDVTSAW